MNSRTESEHDNAISASCLHLMQFAVTHSLDELLEETLNEAEKLTDSVIGFYHFVNDDQKSLILQNWSTRTKAEFCKAEGKGLHYAIAEAGVWVDCVGRHKAVIHNDYASLPNRKGLPEGHAVVIRELVVPVLRGDKIRAILGVGNKPSDYIEKDVETISLLADLAWEIADRKRAEEERLCHLRFLGSLDRVNRAMQGTTDLGQMMSDVLDVVLSIFECDRAWLLYPLDPAAESWRVPIIRFRPEYSPNFPPGGVVPMVAEASRAFRIILNSNDPVKFGPEAEYPVPSEARDVFGVQSQIAIAIHPKVGKPWMFGLHQCSHPRVWIAEDERLVQEIGRRLEDGLTSLLTHRDLLESEARYRQIVDTAAEGIWVVGPDIMTRFVNARMAEMLGCSAEEMKDRPLTDFIFEEDVPDYLSKIESRREGKSEYYEHRFRRQGGQTLWALVSATPIFDEKHRFNGSFGMFTDITDRKHAETRLNEQLHFLQQLLDSIPIPVYYKDVDGLYLGCNSAFETFIGLSRGQIVGKTVYEVAAKDRADKHHEADLTLIRQPGEKTYEASGMYKDGEYHDVIFNKATFVDANGHVAGTVGAMMDITSLRKAEEARKILEAQLNQAQKMEAIGQLAGGIAHDFNNILTAIIGYAEIIFLRMEKDSPLRHFVEQVLTSAERAAELTNGLLTFSRRQVLHPKPIDLSCVVRNLKKMLRRLVPEDIEFRTTVFAKELVVMADKSQIEQVLMNFVTNAKDAMTHGGLLSIEVSPVKMDKGFVHAHGFGEPGDYACITVADTGCGMDEETQKKMFEPFYTTKEVGKGTGLGMAIIYGIVKQHNGYINLYSEPGTGTTFRVYLPLFAEENNDIPNIQNPEPPEGGTETILLVEDDETVRELHRMILEEAGYTVIEAFDGQDALAKFMEHHSAIDMLTTDVIMPRIDGKRLFKEIQRLRPEMKVLFMSGYTKDTVIERGILDDESNFIAKPVMCLELLAKVRHILDRP